MLKIESLSSATMSESFVVPDRDSFEVSFWFKNNLSRLEKIEKNYNSKNNEKIKKKREEAKRIKCAENRNRIKKKWDEFSKQISYNHLIYTLEKAKDKLEQLKKEKGRKPKKPKEPISYPEQLLLSKTSSEFETEKTNSYQPEEETTELIIDKNSEYGELWRSFANRFMKQTMYNDLLQAQEDLYMQRRREKAQRIEKWSYLTDKYVRSTQTIRLEDAAANLEKQMSSWEFLVQEIVHRNLMNNVQRERDEYFSHKYKNYEQYQQFWRKCMNYLLKRERALKSVREALAMDTISRFFQYVLVPIRAAKSIGAIKFGWKKPIQREIRKEMSRSARKIKNCALAYRNQMATNFSVNFTSCLVDACSAVAIYHIGKPPEKMIPPPPKAPPIKQKKQPAPKKKPKKPIRKGRTKDAATNPERIPPKKDDIYSEEETYSSSVLSQLEEHQMVDIEIDNNDKEDAIVNDNNCNIQIVKIIDEKPEQKSQFEIIKGPTETVSPKKEEEKKEEKPKTPPQQKPLTKEIQITNQFGIEEIQTPVKKTSSVSSKGSKSSRTSKIEEELLKSPNISTLVEMYNSGSSLEEIDSSIDEVKGHEFELIDTGSPIKKGGEYTEEESLLTGTPASISSIRNSSMSSNHKQPSPVRLTYSTSSSPAFASSHDKSNEVNLLKQNVSAAFTFNDSINKTPDFIPYQVYDSDEMEETEQEDYESNESSANFVFEDDDIDDTATTSEEEIPFIFNDSNTESQTRFSLSRPGSSSIFIFESSSTENESKESDVSRRKGKRRMKNSKSSPLFTKVKRKSKGGKSSFLVPSSSEATFEENTKSILDDSANKTPQPEKSTPAKTETPPKKTTETPAVSATSMQQKPAEKKETPQDKPAQNPTTSAAPKASQTPAATTKPTATTNATTSNADSTGSYEYYYDEEESEYEYGESSLSVGVSSDHSRSTSNAQSTENETNESIDIASPKGGDVFITGF